MAIVEKTASRLVQNLSLTSSNQATTSAVTIRNAVIQYLQHYLSQLWGRRPENDIYEKILNEVEPPLLEMTLQYCHHNQVKAAEQLGISRGTLRKKMQKYVIRKNKNQAAE